MLIIVNNCIVGTSLIPQRTHIFQLFLYKFNYFIKTLLANNFKMPFPPAEKVSQSEFAMKQLMKIWFQMKASQRNAATTCISDRLRHWHQFTSKDMISMDPISHETPLEPSSHLKPQILQTWSQTRTGRIWPGPRQGSIQIRRHISSILPIIHNFSWPFRCLPS